MRTILFSAVLLSNIVSAGDWPIYRGIERSGISMETEWQGEWAGAPRELWAGEVGIGFSSFVVAGGRVLTTGNDDNEDTVWCLDAESGAVVWKHSYPADLGDKYFEGGTAATPTIDGGRVYQLSRWGDVFCLNASDGTVVWSRQLEKEKGFAIPDWGFAGSPVIHGDLVILNVGESGVALNKADGADAWVSGNDTPAGYSTPFPVKLGDREAYIIGSADHYNAVDGKTGDLIWSLEWKTRYGVNAADPILSGDELFISSGYAKGCSLFKLNGGAEPKEIWGSKELRNQFNSSILIDGFLYGIHDDESKKADFRCVEWSTGKVKWDERSIGFGALAAADGKLIVQTEKGELVIVEATPSDYTEISRAQVLSGRCWTTPVLANGLLYARNAEGQMKCFDLRK